MGTIIATKPLIKRVMRERREEGTMRTITEKRTAIEERALIERRESALLYMELTLTELAKREKLCREEIVHFTKLLLTKVEEAR